VLQCLADAAAAAAAVSDETSEICLSVGGELQTTAHETAMSLMASRTALVFSGVNASSRLGGTGTNHRMRWGVGGTEANWGRLIAE